MSAVEEQWKYETQEQCIEAGEHLDDSDDEDYCTKCGWKDVDEDKSHDNLVKCLLSGDHLADTDSAGDCRYCDLSNSYAYDSVEDCHKAGRHLDKLDDDGDCVLCWGSRQIEDVDEEESPEEEDTDGPSVQHVVSQMLWRDTLEENSPHMRNRTELEAINDSIKKHYYELDGSDRRMVDRIFDCEADGYNPEPALNEDEEFLREAVKTRRESLVNEILARTSVLLIRRAAGESPTYLQTKVYHHIAALEGAVQGKYATFAVDAFKDHYVKLSVETNGGTCPYAHIWVRVDGPWENTDGESHDDLGGEILSVIDEHQAGLSVGEKVSFKITEVLDCFIPNRQVNNIKDAVLAVLMDGEQDVEEIRRLHGFIDSPAKTQEIWWSLSDQEKVHVNAIAGFLRRRKQRPPAT